VNPAGAGGAGRARTVLVRPARLPEGAVEAHGRLVRTTPFVAPGGWTAAAVYGARQTQGRDGPAEVLIVPVADGKDHAPAGAAGAGLRTEPCGVETSRAGCEHPRRFSPPIRVIFLELPVSKEMLSVSQLRPTVSRDRFDSNGARKAAISMLTAIYKTGRHGTLAEVLIALEVIDSNLDGRPHSMKSLSSKLGIPYTSVSRIVYSLTSEAQPGGLLKLVPDGKDRRRKHIELDPEAFKRSGSQVRALEKAMIDYYGSSVYKLKREKAN
jgi:hypothetical protein